MIEEADSTAGVHSARESAPPSAGQLLRRAREATGMHIGTLAVTLKVPVKKLEALESDRWDLLPDAVFVRALAASVCRTLKVDSTEILEYLPHSAPKLMPNDAGINAPFREGGSPGAGWSAASLLSRPLVLAVAALILGALALVLWPGLPQAPSVSGADGGQVGKYTGTVPAATASQIDSRAADVPASRTSSSLESETGSSALTSISGLTSSFAAEPRAVVESPTDSTRGGSESRANPASLIVVFKTTGSSWIQVTDAKGVTVLKKLMGAGESATATGLLPLSVLVGRVDATTVEIGGKPFDMTPVSRENIARFEVNP